jgi:hypothetical protein
MVVQIIHLIVLSLEFFFFNGFFYVCVKLHENFIITCSPIVGIAKMWQDSTNQNNILLDYYIIHICIDFIT